MSLPLAKFDAAVLVGGLGTRLRPILGQLPKPLAPVLGRPFLFYLLDWLALRGARSVTLCCRYQAEEFRKAVGTTWLGMPVFYSIENQPLGTGGGLSLAARSMSSPYILALNGDSWFEPDWQKFLAVASNFTAALAAAEVPDASRFGSLEIDSAHHHVIAFHEKKSEAGPGFINAGIYLIERAWLAAAAPGACSLEKDLFPGLVRLGKLGATPTKNPFLDIGVPGDYEKASVFFRDLGISPHSMFPDFPEMSQAQVKLGACVVICDGEGRIILEHRSDCGWWCLPGGKLDPGEKLEECAVREASEETGLEVELGEFLGVFSDPTRRTVRYPDNGDLRQLVDAAWLARPIGGSLRKSPESLDLKWFPLEKLPLNTVPPVIEILRKIPQP